jgi:hypothetical protein
LIFLIAGTAFSLSPEMTEQEVIRNFRRVEISPDRSTIRNA